MPSIFAGSPMEIHPDWAQLTLLGALGLVYEGGAFTNPGPNMTTRLAALAFALTLAIGCSDSTPGEPTEDAGSDAVADVDSGSDAVADTGSDTAPDATPDAEDAPDVSLGPCETQDDCPESALCVEENCESLACGGDQDWVVCRDLFNRLGDERGRYATCTNRQCRESCYFDTDCEDGQVCTDFGECQDFLGDLSLEHPHGPATGPVQAGVSNVLMSFPIGVPLGGYGQRAAYLDGRYAVSLKSSAGQMHGLYARALLLDNGERSLMTVRLPIIFSSMALHEDVARALQERTGRDWRQSLMISSTHTHSGPCRHWHLPLQAAAPLGSFGIGEFHQFFYDRILETTLEAAMAALDDLSPARVGWEVLEAYDVEDEVARDRWGPTPPFDDNRALFIRVDDPEGVPRAVLFSFGAHGTENESDLLTGDVLAAAERYYEERLGEEFGRFVPTLFINQNSGTMGPAGGSQGHDFPMRVERLGWAFLDRTWDDFVEMETTDQMTLDSRNIRFSISYDQLGYDRGQFSGAIEAPFGGEYHYGGLSCVGDHGGDGDYETHQNLERMSCAGALQFLLFNSPPTTLVRSQMMMFELNGLTAAVVPGELSMELSWQMLRDLRDEFGVDPFDAWTFGYANDHLFYLLPTNLRGEAPPFPGFVNPLAPDDYPDFAYSYLQGGYESTMSMWGPRQGDYLVDRLVETYRAMIDPAAEPEFAEPMPSQYASRDEEAFVLDITPSDQAGTWMIEAPAEVERLETIEFSWVGGDPGAEAPQSPLVTLEFEGEDGWAPVILPSQREYTNREMLFVTRVRQAGDGDPWEWVIRWEELSDFPLGNYRFRIDGHYLNQSEERASYQLITDPIAFVGASTGVASVEALSSTSVSGTIGMPPEERGRFSGPSSDPARASGNFRMRHPMVPTGVPGPVDIEGGDMTITIGSGEEAIVLDGDGVEVSTSPESVSGRNGVPVTRFSATWESELAAGTYPVSVSFTDGLGNTGEGTGELTIE